MAMRSSVSSTCGFSAASIAASERLPWSSSSSSSGSGAGGGLLASSSSSSSVSSSSSSSSDAAAAGAAAGRRGGSGRGRRGGGCRRRGGVLRAESTLSTSSCSIWPEKVVSRSITSRSMIASSSSSSRQMVMAWKVSGLSQRPAIMVLRPASMRLAMAISPSRDRSSTEPISRRYMRTGSSVRSSASPPTLVIASSREPPSSAAGGASSRAPSSSSASSLSMTLMPISESIAITSSICSEVTCSGGRTSFSSS